MHGTILTQKLLTVMLAALMACPSWAVRDCCCTRGARQIETGSCCSTRQVETKQTVSPCCAARMKLAARSSNKTATQTTRTETHQHPSSCRPVSSCRCHSATTVATLTKPISTETGNGNGLNVAKPPLWTIEARKTASQMLPSVVADGSGFDGPTGRCVRFCRWLT